VLAVYLKEEGVEVFTEHGMCRRDKYSNSKEITVKKEIVSASRPR
jgi:hypothetical protein